VNKSSGEAKEAKKNSKTEVENILYKRISRREFIKKAAIGVGAVALGSYAVSQLLKNPVESSTFKNDAPATLWKWSKEAYHYTKLGNNVQCQVCPNKCILENNARSVCRLKVNKDGKLYTLAYGNPHRPC
jgi:pyruvate formate lyase activating enzyme